MRLLFLSLMIVTTVIASSAYAEKSFTPFVTFDLHMRSPEISLHEDLLMTLNVHLTDTVTAEDSTKIRYLIYSWSVKDKASNKVKIATDILISPLTKDTAKLISGDGFGPVSGLPKNSTATDQLVRVDFKLNDPLASWLDVKSESDIQIIPTLH